MRGRKSDGERKRVMVRVGVKDLLETCNKEFPQMF